MTTGKILHQFTEGMYTGDAVSDHVFLIRRWLRELGFVSNIYAEVIQPELERHVLPAESYLPGAEETGLIQHHAVGSRIADRLAAINLPQILIYHNITPPEFFAATNPHLAVQLDRGRQQLEEMRARTVLALGDSAYNERELRQLGFEKTGVLPIVVDESSYDAPLNSSLAAENHAGGPLLLFVGRLAPNKCQGDLVKLLIYYRRLAPNARLVCVGSLQDNSYVNWIQGLSRVAGLPETAVTLTGHISQQDMVTYYKTADLFVSMSEHEGFGKPLIESMFLGLPVLAYAVTAVPDTMGTAGVLFHEKDYEALAELVDMLISDNDLRRRLIVQQKKHVEQFRETAVFEQWRGYLEQINLYQAD